jgi:hypothetical protein
VSFDGYWKLCDDGKPYEEHVRSQGTETAVKALYHEATSPRKGAIKIEPGNAYVEDPDGEQFAWNPHTSQWDTL